MTKPNISVLMSLYMKEEPEYLRESLKSILAQTMQPAEVVIVLDGPISIKLQDVLDEYCSKSKIFRILPQLQNKGLGSSLAVGIKACKSPLIARMDTDDVMRADRLELQYQQFEADEQLSICGSNIREFEGSIAHTIGHRVVPETNTEIRTFSRRRNPFNHMAVMYKREAVLTAGNYQTMPGFEDYYLWARMLKAGSKGFNIQQDLVFARVGLDMYARRGGFKYLWPGIRGRYYIYQAGLGKFDDFLFVSCVHVVVSLMPNNLRGWLYAKKLHS